jgi:glutamine amidotransferase
MCRLFGFRSAVVSRAHRSLIAAENALADQARGHPHGWGIGWFVGDDAYVVKRDAAAADCDAFRETAERLSSNTLVAHVRRATVGQVSGWNTHPFRNGRWLFAHNGTLHGFEGMAARMQADTPAELWRRRLGETDSEAFFFFLLGMLTARGVDTAGMEPAPTEAVAAAARDARAAVQAWAAAAGEEPPIVNFLLTNGADFFAQRSGRELFFATQKFRCRDALTCAEPEKPCLLAVRPHDRVNHLLVTSERIGDEDVWEEMEEDSLLALGRDFRLQRFRI